MISFFFWDLNTAPSAPPHVAFAQGNHAGGEEERCVVDKSNNRDHLRHSGLRKTYTRGTYMHPDIHTYIHWRLLKYVQDLETVVRGPYRAEY
jgi:hypothetical protein